MSSRAPSTSGRAGGFTLIELMIGVAIGLLASLAVTHVLVNSEGQKRSTTSGSDAQVNGALALATLQRSLQPAGYGFAASPAVLGCTVTATFNGAPIANFPTVLAPVVITDGAGGLPDTVRVLASGKSSFSIPLRVVAPGYTTGGTNFPVQSVRGIAQGDLVLAANSISGTPSVPCEVFQVTDNPGSLPQVARADNAWNAAAAPVATYGDGAGLINLGQPLDVTYSIAGNALMMRQLAIDTTDPNYPPSYPAANEIFPNIVQLQVLYGRDTTGTPDGKVDIWDTTTPTDNDGWRRIIAVRVAVVSRSNQFEKEDVTHANLSWDVGNGIAVTGSATCGTSKCLSIKIDHLGDDWKRYRYRLFETIVPLRNMIWNS